VSLFPVPGLDQPAAGAIGIVARKREGLA
jgi:hypothetical protein